MIIAYKSATQGHVRVEMSVEKTDADTRYYHFCRVYHKEVLQSSMLLINRKKVLDPYMFWESKELIYDISTPKKIDWDGILQDIESQVKGDKKKKSVV